MWIAFTLLGKDLLLPYGQVTLINFNISIWSLDCYSHWLRSGTTFGEESIEYSSSGEDVIITWLALSFVLLLIKISISSAIVWIEYCHHIWISGTFLWKDSTDSFSKCVSDMNMVSYFWWVFVSSLLDGRRSSNFDSRCCSLRGVHKYFVQNSKGISIRDFKLVT